MLVANLYEIYNFFSKNISSVSAEDLKVNYIKILCSLNPILPHLSAECFEDLNIKNSYQWPEIEKKYLIQSKTSIVIQINSKKRSIMEMQFNINEKALMQEIYKDAKCNKYLEDKIIVKTIFIKDKLINIITD